MYKIDGSNALDDLQGVTVKHIKENKSKTSFTYVETIENDTIPMEKIKKVFEELKNDGLLIAESFDDVEWKIYDKMIEQKYTLNFDFINQKETIKTFKKYIIVKFGLNNTSTGSVIHIYLFIRKMLVMTNNLDLDYIDDLKDYITSDAYSNELSIYKEFLKFSTNENAKEYFNELECCSAAKTLKARDLPSFTSIVKYDELFNDYMNKGRRDDLYYKYYPLLIWWEMSIIIPLRPSEFVILKRDCLKMENGKYYIHIERVKNKNGKKANKTPIMKDFNIPKDFFEFIQDFIDFENDIDGGESEYLVSQEYYNHYLERHSPKIDSNKMAYHRLYFLFNSFIDDIVAGVYHYNVVELGQAKPDTNDIERLKLGDTRHFAFMNMVLQGINSLYIQRIGGHYTTEEQLHYCSHLNDILNEKVVILAKTLDEKNSFFMTNPSKDYEVNRGQKEFHKLSMGLEYYDLPQVLNGKGRCDSKNIPFDCCECDDCLFCKHFYPEKNVERDYYDKIQKDCQDNLAIKKKIFIDILTDICQDNPTSLDERDAGQAGLELAGSANQYVCAAAYALMENDDKSSNEDKDINDDAIKTNDNGDGIIANDGNISTKNDKPKENNKEGDTI
jgi:hypothetical protein